MRVPAVEGERADARPVRRARGISPPCRPHRRRRRAPAPGSPAAPRGLRSAPSRPASPARARMPRSRRPSSTRASSTSVWLIEVEQPRHGVFARRLACACGVHDSTGVGPRTTSGVTGPTAKARRSLRTRASGCEPAERAVEPAGVGAARLGQPAFQHVLPVEMRALAIGRRRRMHDRGLARPCTCRCRFGIAGLSAKNESSGSAGVLPSSVSALSPRSLTQSGSPTGATAASPSSAPRSTMVSMRGSRPSARASFGRNGQANSTPAPASSSRRVEA